MKKKNVFWFAAAVLAIAAGTGLAGCNVLQGVDVTKQPAVDAQRTEYAAQTETGKVFQNLLGFTVQAVSATAEKTMEYDSGARDQLAARSARSEDNLDLSDLLSLADMGKTRSGAARSAEGIGQTTLADELDAIIAEYNQNVAAYTPDLSFLDGVGYMTVEDGLVILDDDIIIDPSTMAGIIQLNVIKAQLAGEDLDTIIADMEQAAAAYGGKDEDEVRGLYKLATRKWPGKTVCYAWGTISEWCKDDFTIAMTEWSNKVPGLTFVDKTDDAGYVRAAELGQKSLVVLESVDDLGKGVGGRATVGALSGKSSCKVRDDQSLITYRHELGHTLGLQHEHQRWDRDLYLSFNTSVVKNNKTNWELIPKEIRDAVYDWYWDYFTVYVFPLKIRVYYLTYGKVGEKVTRKADGTSELDYKSIMLYWSTPENIIRAKVEKQGYKIGDKIQPNYVISANDIVTVKKMYP